MKNITILLATAVILFSTGCAQSKASDMLKNDAQKKEIISAILSNDQASSELMDSLMIRHHEEMMMKMNTMMTGDTMMQQDMMTKMMDMCDTDSSMCKIVMGKMMDMCDTDQSKCNMMMGSMQSHAHVMKSMQGMCDMKGMKMGKMK